MAKKGEKLTAFEEEVVDHFMRDYMEGVELGKDTSAEELEKLIIKSKYGDDFSVRIPFIRWGDMFGKHVCPVCNGLLSLQEKQYACNKCSLRIPLQLFDKAAGSFEKEAKTMSDNKEFDKKIEMNNRISEERLDELYDMALDLAAKKIREKGQ